MGKGFRKSPASTSGREDSEEYPGGGGGRQQGSVKPSIGVEGSGM